MKVIYSTIYLAIYFAICCPSYLYSYTLNNNDLKKLPSFCRYTQDTNPGSAQYKKLVKIHGKVWTHMHHFCRGLDKLNKAFGNREENLRRSGIFNAIREFDYVLDRSPHSFKLYPMILTIKGNCLQSLGNTADAYKMYATAIKAQPKYVDAYISLSNLYLSMGYREKAINILKKGLKYSKKNKKLEKSINKLKSN